MREESGCEKIEKVKMLRELLYLYIYIYIDKCMYVCTYVNEWLTCLITQ